MRSIKQITMVLIVLILTYVACSLEGEGRSEMVLTVATSPTDFGARERADERSGNQSEVVRKDLLAQYQAVYITLRGIRLHQLAEGAEEGAEAEEVGHWKTLLVPPRTVNFLELQEGLREAIGTLPLEMGQYTEMRILLGSSPDNDVNLLGQAHRFPHYVIDKEGKSHPLEIPSGDESGIKINPGFHVEEGEVIELLVEIDLTRSIVPAGERYQFKPVIHSVQISDVLIEEETP